MSVPRPPRVEYMKPQHWQGALRLGKKADHGSRWKAHLKSRTQALFPKVDVTLKTADALLILEAGRMHTSEGKSTNLKVSTMGPTQTIERLTRWGGVNLKTRQAQER